MKKLLIVAYGALLLNLHLTVHGVAHVRVQPEPEDENSRQVLQELQDQVQDVVAELPRQLIHDLVLRNPYRTKTAMVRETVSDDIPKAEKQFSKQRAGITKHALAKFLGKPVSGSAPRIALAFSGGGFRAMISTLGFLKGAHDINLLGATHYMAGLSGSSWALAPWLASGKSISDYLTDLSVRLKGGIQPLSPSKELIKAVLSVFITKFLYGQSVTAMDIYGALLARLLLHQAGISGMSLSFSDAHKQVGSARIPLPLYTAIETTVKPYEWMEVSPFEVGSSYVKSYVPVWAFGRTFDNKNSVTSSSMLGFAPEQTLGYFMAVFGSAFEVALKDIIEHSADIIDLLMQHLPEAIDEYFGKSTFYSMTYAAFKAVAPKILENFFGDLSKYIEQAASSWSDIRLLPDVQPNFTYNMAGMPLADVKTLSMVDAGIDFNLPIPPLLRKARGVDVIIAYDLSSNISGPQGAAALRKAEKYARDRGYKFPSIDYKRAAKEPVSVFKDLSDPETPTVIYFPLINDPAYKVTQCDASGQCTAVPFNIEDCMAAGACATSNFDYDREDVERLAGLAEFTIKKHADVIKKAVEEKIQA